MVIQPFAFNTYKFTQSHNLSSPPYNTSLMYFAMFLYLIFCMCFTLQLYWPGCGFMLVGDTLVEPDVDGTLDVEVYGSIWILAAGMLLLLFVGEVMETFVYHVCLLMNI